jgi:hypothetical protein
MRGNLLIVLAALGGCATITKGTTQTVAVDTPGAPGAQCTLSSSTIGQVKVVSPAVVTLNKGSESVAVRCSEECYNDGAGVIGTHAEAMAAGSVLVGGVIGLGIDAASGAMNKYTEQNQITLVAIPGCKARTL